MRIGRATADRGTPGQRRSKGRGGMRRALRSGAAAGAVAGAAGALGVTLLPAISGAFATPAWASPATQAAVAPTASAPVAASGLLESSRGSGVVAVATSPTGGGWYAYANGAVGSFGGATNYGSMAGKVLNRPIVGIASTPDGRGYWLVAADGGVFSFGDAGFFGSAAASGPPAPVAGISVAPGGGGYLMITSTGGLLGFGSARAASAPAGRGSSSAWPRGQLSVGMLQATSAYYPAERARHRDPVRPELGVRSPWRYLLRRPVRRCVHRPLGLGEPGCQRGDRHGCSLRAGQLSGCSRSCHPRGPAFRSARRRRPLW